MIEYEPMTYEPKERAYSTDQSSRPYGRVHVPPMKGDCRKQSMGETNSVMQPEPGVSSLGLEVVCVAGSSPVFIEGLRDLGSALKSSKF